MPALPAAENTAVDWGTWSGALLLSFLLHALALVLLYSIEVVVPEIGSPAILPVTIRAPARPPARPLPPPDVPRPPVSRPAEPEPPPPPEPEERTIPLPEQQVVSPSEGGIERAPEKTRLLSDTDVTVEQQQVRRGEPAPGEGEDGARSARKPSESAKPAAPARTTAERRALPDLKGLLPDAVQLARQGYGQPAEEADGAEEREERRDRARSGGGWPTTSQTFGTLDFLPDVREGDITLLNTKADLFAPFVRRVAVRVFQNLLIALRRDLSQTGPSTREQVAAEAVMDEHGNMVAVEITERSTGVSLGIDRKLRQACADGFFDRNPPPGAEAPDGRIRFVLRTEVASISDQRGYRVGYRVVFQAGLL